MSICQNNRWNYKEKTGNRTWGGSNEPLMYIMLYQAIHKMVNGLHFNYAHETLLIQRTNESVFFYSGMLFQGLLCMAHSPWSPTQVKTMKVLLYPARLYLSPLTKHWRLEKWGPLGERDHANLKNNLSHYKIINTRQRTLTIGWISQYSWPPVWLFWFGPNK